MNEKDHTNKRFTIGRNFSWMTLGQIINALGQWSLLAILAKIADSQAVGQYSLALVITTPIFMFTNLGLNHIQATDVNLDYKFGHFCALRTIMGLVGFLSICLILVFVNIELEIAMLILVVGLTKLIVSQSEVLYGLFQACERMDYWAKSVILRNIISVLSFGFCIKVTGSLLISSVIPLVVSIVVLVLFDRKNGKNVIRIRPERQPNLDSKFSFLTPLWDRSKLTQLFWEAIPLGFMAMLVSLQIYFPQLIVVENLGVQKLGIFSAMIYIVIGGNHVINALGLSSSVPLARYYTGGLGQFYFPLVFKMIGVSLIFGGSGILISYHFGENVLFILYSLEYTFYSKIFFWLTVGAFFQYIATMLQFVLVASRRFRLIFLNNFLATLIAAVGSLALIPDYGLWGGVLVVNIVFGARLIGGLILAVFVVKKHFYA